MNKVAIAFNTRDTVARSKIESIQRVVERLLQPDLYDLWWFDGSDTESGRMLPFQYANVQAFTNVRGSGDAAVVFALTSMLAASANYSHIGIVEDDVLMPEDWFFQTMRLFAVGELDGLRVGAASIRAYEDRVLIQRDGYAVMHNLGWGQLILTREAAQITLDHYRTGWSTENRRVFCQLSGKDVAGYWAFRGKEQWICSDWGNDAVLAQTGLASLALTPSPVEMIFQNPPLDQQGLRLVKRPVDMLRDDRVFEHFVERLNAVRKGHVQLDARPRFFRLDDGGYIYFSHQLGALRAEWGGDWELEHNLGFGPFGFRATENSSLTLKLSGPIDILIGGGKKGGTAMVRDFQSGYEVEPNMAPAAQGAQLFMACVVPTSVSWRTVVVDRITPGVVVYGVRTRETQPVDPRWRFDASQLPRAMISEETEQLEAAQ